jgi:hypothetical protein
MKPYPKFAPESLEDVKTIIMRILDNRPLDIAEFTNLNNVFIAGRKSGKIPSGSADIAISDRVGDISYDANYLYIVIDDAGSAEWRRVALASW